MRSTTPAVTVLLLLACASAAIATAVKQQPASRIETTRSMLAAAYKRIDQAISVNTPSGTRLSEVNRAFDAASMLFFANRFDEAASRIDELTLSLLSDTPEAQSLRRIAGISCTLTPPILPLDSGREATITLVRQPGTEHHDGDPVTVRIEVVSTSGTVVGGMRERDDAIELSDALMTIPILLNEHAAPGRVSIVAYVDRHPHPLTLQLWSLVASRLDPIRQANAMRLSALIGREHVHPQSLATAGARNRLLVDSPSTSASAQFLANHAALVREIENEIAAMERGDDPYIGRTGDHWRVVAHQDIELPLRMYVPTARQPDSRRPLVIALHGAGGDENMFPEAYGAGIIKSLAEENDFILVSPLTYPLAGDVTLLDSLIEEMDRCFSIDRERIHLIGHSLGGMTALGLSQMRRDVIASCCAIAGGSIPRNASIPPTLVIAAEFDGLAGLGAAERGLEAAQRAKANGIPVDYRIMRDWGHTLVVGAALPEAVQWLLSHRRSPDEASDARNANSTP